MKHASAAVICLVAAVSFGAMAQSQGGAASAQPQQSTTKVPPMSEDKRVKTGDIDKMMSKNDMILLDVREPKEIDELGGYEGAINIPIGQLEKRLGELPKDKTILTA